MIESITNIPENATVRTLVVCSIDDLRAIMHECILTATPAEEETAEDGDKLLTAEEVMARLHCNRSTLWRWNKDEYLCHKKVGKKNMYLEADVNKLIKKS